MSIKDQILETEFLRAVFVRADHAISEVNAAFSEVEKSMPKPTKLKFRLMRKSIDKILLDIRHFQRMIPSKRPK